MKLRIRIAAVLTALPLALLFVASGVAREAGTAAEPGATEANITRVTAGLLGRSHFAHQSLDDQLANAFLEHYLDVLDSEHSLFVQADVQQFSAHRATLATNTRSTGDAQVAHAIFARYVERLEQRVAYIKATLPDANFDFSGRSKYMLDRKNAPRPVDLAAARKLWWERLRVEYLQEKLADQSPEDIVKTLSRRADRQLQAVRQMSRDGVLEIYLSALAQIYDPHSDYLGHEQLAEFAIAMKLSLFGIGARLRSEGRGPKIIEILAGGPAARSGLLNPGDRIVAVAQGSEEPVDVVDLRLARAVALIRGPKGTVVNLTIVPAGAVDDSVRKTVTLVRDEIQLEKQRVTSRIVDMPNADGGTLRLGVIDLPSFYADLSDRRGRSGRNVGSAQRTRATTDVAQLLEKLKAEKVQGIVLDLRRNGGGSLQEAIDVTGLFIAEGPVVQTRGFDGDIEVVADSDSAVAYDGPLLVLTSRFSASASEILAAALQDYGRAIIVGASSTYGKGTVQSLVPLAPIMERSGLHYAYDPGALKITIRKFYRPGGASTQLRGVVPDIVLPSLSSRSDAGESVLENPLPWDSVPAADYEQLAMVAPYIATLRNKSALRVDNGAEFVYLRAEIARLAQRLATKTVSLNEAVRRQELADAENRKQEHKKILAELDAAFPVTYELSLRDAALPGLPPPTTQTEISATLQAAESGAAGASEETDQEVAENQSPRRDVILNEAQKITADYVLLLGRQSSRETTGFPLRAAAQ